MTTPPTDYKKLAERTRETHDLMHWQSDNFDTCEDEECKLARAVLALDAENQRLRTALEKAGDDICSEFCGTRHSVSCLMVKKALKPQR